MTEEQAAAVKALVSTHHPELAALLAQLKESRPTQYTMAVRTLFRTSVRLAAIQERDMERYNLELKRWKLESQSQLLALRVVRKNNDRTLRAELTAISKQLLQTRIQLVELEQTRQLARLERLNEQHKQFVEERESLVETNVADLIRSATALTKAQSKRKNAGRKAKREKGDPKGTADKVNLDPGLVKTPAVD